MNRIGDLIEKFFNSLLLGMYASFSIGIFIFIAFAIFDWDGMIAIYISLGIGFVIFILGMLSDGDDLKDWSSRLEQDNRIENQKENELYMNWALKDYHRSKGRRV